MSFVFRILMMSMVLLPVITLWCSEGLKEHAPDGWDFYGEDDPFETPAAVDLAEMLNEPEAGALGHVRLSHDKESFVRGDGQPIRFWGVVSEGWKLAPEEMERHARWLAKRGVNIVRVHANLSVPHEGSSVTEVDGQALDGILRWVAVCKRHGIYTMLSPYWAYAPAPSSWGLEGYAGDQPWGLLFFHPKMQEGYKAWARALYTTPNPYAGGVPLRDEPSVAIAQVKNEDSLLFWTFHSIREPQKRFLGQKFFEWAKNKYGSMENIFRAWDNTEAEGDDLGAGVLGFRNLWEMTSEAPLFSHGHLQRLTDQLHFLAATQRKFYEEMERFYKQDLGVKCLTNAMNWKSADPVLLDDAERWTYTAMDVIAVNFYTGGEHFGQNHGYRIDPGHRFTNRSVLRGGAPMPAALKQPAGFPMMVTETAWVHPNLYQSEGPFLMTALQSLNGVDITCWFAYPGRSGPEWEKDPRAPFWPVGDSHATFKWYGNHPMQAGQFPLWAFAYRQNLIEASPQVAVWEERKLEDLWSRKVPIISESGRFDPNRDPGSFAAQSPIRQQLSRDLFWLGPVKVLFNGNPGKSQVVELAPWLNKATGLLQSMNKQFYLDRYNGVAWIDAPAVQGVCGFLQSAGGQWTLSSTRWQSCNHYAALAAVALDGRPLAESRRVLVQTGTTCRLRGFRSRPVRIEENGLSEEGEEIIHNGTPPWRIEKTLASLEILNPHLRQATSLCPNLYRKAPVPMKRTGNRLRFDLPQDALYTLLE